MGRGCFDISGAVPFQHCEHALGARARQLLVVSLRSGAIGVTGNHQGVIGTPDKY